MTAYPRVDGPDAGSEPAIGELVARLREQHNDAVSAVLLYGSCLRSGDIYDGLLDLYLVLDNYRSGYRRTGLALANWLLPPNVFYAEQAHGERTLRSKVTVISLQDFRRGCSRGWFQSYIWGRFAQPTRIAWSRDAGTREALEECLLNAVHTLMHRSLPVLPAEGSLVELWEQALSLSYGTELRTEKTGRARELVSAAGDFYGAVSRYHADTFDFAFHVQGDQYSAQIPERTRALSKAGWQLRTAQGKALSVLRLVKALFTFTGGLDYIAWKLERHSGETITIPDRVRRRPLIHMWGFFWDLYRRGIFR